MIAVQLGQRVGQWLLLAARPQNRLTLPGTEGIGGALGNMALPIVAFLLAAPLLWLFFRQTWRELDLEATHERLARHLSRRPDYRPWVMFSIVGIILTAQYYYGGHEVYSAYVRPWLLSIETKQMFRPGGPGRYVDTFFYGELYSYGWWAVTRVAGYTLIPYLVWKLIYPRDSLLDMGLRVRGMFKHTPVYLACLAVVIPLVFAASRSPEFASYYPFYSACSRSWLDLILWEAMYIAQFFALEMFFRGFMLSPLRRSLGSGAIFAMCVPYVMIHFGKPYVEASVAFIAGVALGSLAMRTKSIYWGFAVHVTVALLMDGFALASAGGPGFPEQFWPR